MKINILWRVFRIIFAMIMLSVLAACSSENFPYNPIVQNKVYRPGKIAVVAGHDDDATKHLAEFLTKDLGERSTFSVMSQADITRHLPGYPADIRIRSNEDIKDNENNPVWFLPAEKAKINAIQAKLKVDYVFLVWNRLVKRVTVTNGMSGSTTDYVFPGGNLIEYPGGTVLASTMSVAGSDLSPLALFRDKDYYIVDALKTASGDIAHDFIKVTKSGK